MEGLFDQLPTLNLDLLTKESEGQEGTAGTAKPVFKTNTSGALPFPFDDDEEVEVEDEPDPTKKKKPELLDDEEQEEEDPEKPVKSPIKLIAELLKEKAGVEYKDEEFEDSDDFISNIVSQTTDKKSDAKVEAYKESLPESIKHLIENYEDGVPLGALLEREQAEFAYSSVTPEQLEKPATQQAIVSNYLTEIGWNDTEITDHVKSLEDAGLLEKNAKLYLGKLVTIQKQAKEALFEETKQNKIKVQKQREEQSALLNTTIKDTKEFIEGITTNDLEKKAVFESITKLNKNGQNKISEFLSDPKNYIKMAYIVGVLKGDFTKLKTVAKTSAVREIKETLDAPRKESRFNSVDIKAMERYLKTKPF